MLASWVRQGTSTTGTGTITLDGTPVAGFQAFSNAFSSGDIVHYTIEDGNNRESGIGTLTSGASWTLSRDTILEKLDAGSYSQYPVTGISLSGSAVVGIAASAMSTLSAASSGIDRQSGIGAGAYDSCDIGQADSASSNTISPNRAVYVPVYFLQPKKISTISVYVNTADAGSTLARIGIYHAGSDSQPSRLIEDGSISLTTTGLKTHTLSSPVVLPPGLYYTAFASDSSSAIMRIMASGELVGVAGKNTGGQAQGFYEALSGWSALPSTASVDGYVGNEMVVVLMQ